MDLVAAATLAHPRTGRSEKPSLWRAYWKKPNDQRRNRLVEHLPYYADTIPDYEPGRCHESLWLDLATQHHYQLGFRDFLYDRHNGLSHPIGVERIAATMEYYRAKFAHGLGA